MDLFGDNTFESEDQMLKVWGETLKDANLRHISYTDFVLLMKGQKRDTKGNSLRSSMTGLALAPEGLAAVLEITSEDEDDPLGSSSEKKIPVAPPVDEPDKSAVNIPKSPGHTRNSLGSTNRVPTGVSNSAPATPVHAGKRFGDFELDSPVSMDDCEDSRLVTPLASSYNQVFRGDLTPPQTPVRGPADYVTPTGAKGTMEPLSLSKLIPLELSLPMSTKPMSMSERGRSTSMDESESKQAHLRKNLMFQRVSSRRMGTSESDTAKVIEDKTKTPLVVNRALYRAHREFRHSITEASKRFEDEQMRRAKETLRAQAIASGQTGRASLVMSRGQGMSDESIKGFLKTTLEERQKKMDKANRRGGRGRPDRKKIISDMSGMMGGSGPTHATVAVKAAANATYRKDALSKVQENETPLRKPTKPGEFRKTNYNPFQRRGSMDASPKELSVIAKPNRSSSVDL